MRRAGLFVRCSLPISRHESSGNCPIRVSVQSRRSVTDEHPRVPGVSGDLLPINTPAQAELGRGTLGVRNDAQGRATRPMQAAIPDIPCLTPDAESLTASS